MAEKSIYSRGGNGMTSGGLDRFLAPEAQDFSNLPEHLEEGEKAAEPVQVDCDGGDSDEAVCQIAKAEQAVQAGNHSVKK